jgi:hypothetical protein
MASAILIRTISKSSADLPWFDDFIETLPTDDFKNKVITRRQNLYRQLTLGMHDLSTDFPFDVSTQIDSSTISIIKTIIVPDVSVVQGWSDSDADANWKLYDNAKVNIIEKDYPNLLDECKDQMKIWLDFYKQPGYSITYSQTITP